MPDLNALYSELEPYAESIGRNYARMYNADAGDIQQAARIALWHGLTKYDPNRKCKARTYITPYVKSACQREVYKSDTIHMPMWRHEKNQPRMITMSATDLVDSDPPCDNIPSADILCLRSILDGLTEEECKTLFGSPTDLAAEFGRTRQAWSKRRSVLRKRIAKSFG